MSPSAKPEVRYIAALDEVTVTRDGDCARIEYKEAGVAVTNVKIGRKEFGTQGAGERTLSSKFP